MMHEQICLGGAPVVGFGAPPQDSYEATLAHERATAPATIGGFFVGAIGGALLGNTIHKGAVGATVGTIAGGVSGALGGNLIASYMLRKTWRRIPFTDITKLKAGQQIAMSAAMPGGVVIPPEIIAALKTQLEALANAPASLPTKNFLQYPPGSKLPPYWPADDNLGPNAYRISADVIADAPSGSAGIKDPPSSAGTFEVWVR
jgi:hypothetical protein